MKLHPLTGIIYTISFFIMILAYDNPLYITSLLITMIISVAILGNIKRLKKGLKYSVFTALMIVVINPLINKSGFTIIINIDVPVIGVLIITLEALLYGFVMGVKIITITMLFIMYSYMIDSDDSFSFYSKYAHKISLTFSMTVNILHRLCLDINRVRDVMRLRGVNADGKNIFMKVRAYYPILKVILVSSLEGSISRAEALYSKRYGEYKRTSYSKVRIKKIDVLLIIYSLLMITIFVFGLTNDFGAFNYYPRISDVKVADLEFLIVLIVPSILVILSMWGLKKWKPIK